jgi:hemoglobin
VPDGTDEGGTMTSIYDAIGGRDSVAAAVDLFYERVLADPVLEPAFAETDLDKLRLHQRAFFAVALGGPSDYVGKSMAEAHAGRDITDDQFDRVAGHLSATLTELGIDEGTVGAIIGRVAGLRDDVVSGDASSSAA